MRCAYCDKAVEELRLIESVYEYDPDEVEKLAGRRPSEEGTAIGTITVCPGECADKIRENSIVIIRDVPFELGMQ